MNTKRMYGLDFLKFICCFMVICIHTPMPNSIRDLVIPITRIAVPVFFMITGYFYSVTKENKKEKIQLLKITKLFIGSNILYLGFSFGMCLFKGESMTSYFSFNNIINFIFLNDSPFSGHLWYLGAILYVLIIIYFVEKLFSKEKLYFLIPFLLLGDLILGKYSLLFIKREIPIVLIRNFLFVGLPYFLIGDIIFKKKINIKPKYLILLILFFACTTLLERYLLVSFNLNATRDHYLSTSFLAFFIFILAYNLGNKSESKIYKKCCYIGAELSLDIYIIHPIIITAIYVIMKIMKSTLLINVYNYSAPLLVFLLSIILTKTKTILFKKIKSIQSNN